MADESLKKKTIAGFIWVFAQRTGSKMVSFLVSIILARILLPEECGILSLVVVFIDLCDVFVESGFGKALIQKKDADDLDFSTVFCFSLFIALSLFGVMLLAAPYIAAFYDMPQLTAITRVMSLRVILGAFNTVQRAEVSRNMQFKKFFYATFSGTVISAAVGIGMACMGFGVWSLVGQYLANSFLETFLLFLQVKWRPRLRFSYARMKPLFSFGVKLLAASMINTLYTNFRSLYVGKLYTATDLAYYSRGKQFPNLLMANVTLSLSHALFPAISSRQEDVNEVKGMTRRAIQISAFVMFPMMVGLAAIAEPLVLFLLTEKWLPCVPFLQILSISYALEHVQTANEQAINARGRSDVILKLNTVKKTVGIALILLFTRISVIAMVLAGVAAAFIGVLLNCYVNKKCLLYGYREQMADILPYVLISTLMFLSVRAVSLLSLPTILELIVMLLAGVGSYIGFAALLRVDGFFYVLNLVKNILHRKKK